jgi:hypothetical protein
MIIGLDDEDLDGARGQGGPGARSAFYTLDEFASGCKQKIDALDDSGRSAAYEEIRLIPEDARSWLQWGTFGVGALTMAAPLLFATGGGIPAPIAVGVLIIVYALWVTHDHLDSPSWWQSLSTSRAVLAVL